MAFPLAEVFLGLLTLYMVYSQWIGLDSRYPIVAALVLLVATAVVDAAGDLDAANTLAEFVFFLLAAGVILLLIDHVRAARSTPSSRGPDERSIGFDSPSPDSTDQPERTTDHPLDRLGRCSLSRGRLTRRSRRKQYRSRVVARGQSHEALRNRI